VIAGRVPYAFPNRRGDLVGLDVELDGTIRAITALWVAAANEPAPMTIGTEAVTTRVTLWCAT
jgi:hypothetical protein